MSDLTNEDRRRINTAAREAAGQEEPRVTSEEELAHNTLTGALAEHANSSYEPDEEVVEEEKEQNNVKEQGE